MKEESEFDFNNLFRKKDKLVFLIGAGCSIDSPSCLPAGQRMMEAIVRYTCPEAEISRILEIKELRFEALVEIIRDRLDEDLKLIEYYAQCDKPNIQHFFLADMIKKGHFVMTTNFDLLIEHALLQLNVPKKEIIPVITREDFIKYADPNKLLKKKKKTLYKIHGSTVNLITGEDTKESLVATIQAFGSNKKGMNIFEVEPFKRSLFDNITNKRSLIVLGYSGSDDFDIVPTLKVLKNLKNIIWLNFVKNDGGIAKVYELNPIKGQHFNSFDKIDRILLEIKQMKYVDHVYRIDVNTTRLIKELMDFTPKISTDAFNLNPSDWLIKNIKAPDNKMKLGVAHSIYFELNKYDDAMRILKEFIAEAEATNDPLALARGYSRVGRIYRDRGNIQEAFTWYMKAVPIARPLGDILLKVRIFYNLGLIFKMRGNFEEAMKLYKEALDDAKKYDKLEAKSTLLNGIAAIYAEKKNFSESSKLYNEALTINEELGNLKGMSVILNNIGMIYYDQHNFPKALEYYDKSIQISKQLSDLINTSLVLNNMGAAYQGQMNLQGALEKYNEALQINDRLQNDLGRANCLNNIGTLNYHLMKFPDSLKAFEDALQILNSIGMENSPRAKLLEENIAQVKNFLAMGG